MIIEDLIIYKTCAVTGHRIIKNNFNTIELKEVFVDLISKGIDTFLIGMAIGFDSLCFKILDLTGKDIEQ